MKQEQAYVQGMCNINTAEVAYRRKAMWIGVGLSAALLVAMLLISLPAWIRPIVLFLPVFVAAVGFLQVRNKFCVSYGANAKQNAAEGSTNAQSVSDATSIEADKKKARTMNLQALAITLVVLALSLLIPNFM